MNVDADEDVKVSSRLAYGEDVILNQMHDGELYQFPFRRFYLIMNINHGLARTTDCLPANMAVNLRFHRANSECALLKIDEDVVIKKVSDGSKISVPVQYSENVIPLKNPLLNAFYAFSPELETVMARVTSKNLEINFMG